MVTTSANISLRDRKYLAYLAQTTILENEETLSPIISDYMNEFSITERASLAIEVDFRESPTTPKFSMKMIGDIAGEVGEIKPWFADNCKGEHDTCGMVRFWHLGALTSPMYFRLDGPEQGRQCRTTAILNVFTVGQ